ncbi:hypothetical protein HMN09_00645300 [Mycena chlorophos]|uniref:Uncharacterized protein n=1 Tax=Mycena chlorophos TaxID=658473 RepID=A0A8H6WG04_MYCCL|nr:hypothetical protein HMN09_00645300 [Mycena chlorophos]
MGVALNVETERGRCLQFAHKPSSAGSSSPITTSSPGFDLSFAPSTLSSFGDLIASDAGLDERSRNDVFQFSKMLEGRDGLKMGLVAIYVSLVSTQQQTRALTAKVDTLTEKMEAVTAAAAVEAAQWTKSQRNIILAATKTTVWDCKRLDFGNTGLFLDTVGYLKRQKETGANVQKYKFLDTHLDPPSAALKGYGRPAVSTSKTALRTLIGETLNECLTDTLVKLATKLTGDGENVKVIHAIKLIIMRRLARKNPRLVIDPSLKKKRVEPDTGFDEDRNARLDSDSFLDKITAEYKEKTAEFGNDLQAPAWSSFIAECVQEEKERFPQDKITIIPVVSTPATPARPVVPMPRRLSPGPSTPTTHSAGMFMPPPMQRANIFAGQSVMPRIQPAQVGRGLAGILNDSTQNNLGRYGDNYSLRSAHFSSPQYPSSSPGGIS